MNILRSAQAINSVHVGEFLGVISDIICRGEHEHIEINRESVVDGQGKIWGKTRVALK